MEQWHNPSVAVHAQSSSLCGGEKTHWLVDFLGKHQPAVKSKGSSSWGLWGPRGAAGRWHPCEPPSSPHRRDQARAGEPHRPKGQQSEHRRQKQPPGPMSWDTGQHGAAELPRGTLRKSASMYTEIQQEHSDSGSILTHPDYIDGNPDLIKPKKLLNPVKASKSHQELHRELLMNHKRGLSVDSKPELQRVLEHRRRNQVLRQKKEEEEAKKLQSPFEKELLKRHQRLDQLEKEQEKQEDHAPEFIKVKENLRRTSTVTGEEKAA